MEMNYKLPERKQVTTTYDFLLAQKHVMIAGTSGAGKSVLLNGLIYSVLHRTPQDVEGGAQLVLIDQKGFELRAFADAPHTIVHATDMINAVEALHYCLEIIQKRFAEMVERRIRTYDGSDVYICIDEFADLITLNKKVIMPLVQRIAQIGRAAKVHIILCTQCPLAKIIPTEVKCNFDTVCALRTATKKESEYIIGFSGCEDFPLYGECYIKAPSFQRPIHMTGIRMIPDEEMDRIVNYWSTANVKNYLKLGEGNELIVQ